MGGIEKVLKFTKKTTRKGPLGNQVLGGERRKERSGENERTDNIKRKREDQKAATKNKREDVRG